MLSPAPVVPARSSSPSPGSSLPHRGSPPSLLRLASKQKPPSKRSCLLGGFFVLLVQAKLTQPLRLGEGSPPASPPELLFKAKAKSFPCLEKKFSCLGKVIFLRKKVPVLPQGGELLSEEKFLSFRTKKSPLPQGKYSPSAEREISFRKKIYFLAEEKIFSCGRKFISVRTKINFRICENIFFVYTEINFLIYGNLTPCKPAGNAGSEKGKFDGRKGGFPWAKRGWFSWLRRRSTGGVREGGRRREVGGGAYKKVGSRGSRAPCPTANSFQDA